MLQLNYYTVRSPQTVTLNELTQLHLHKLGGGTMSESEFQCWLHWTLEDEERSEEETCCGRLWTVGLQFPEADSYKEE